MPTEGGLDSQQLHWLVRTDRRLRPSFLGVFPADRLPPTHSPGAGLIVNTDLADQPGTHWVAMYWDGDGRAEFFDSYGQTPQSYHPSWRNYLGRECRYTTRSLQSPQTTVCGHYCLYYLSQRVRGRSLKDIVMTFSGPPRVNDRRVCHWVCRSPRILRSQKSRQFCQSSVCRRDAHRRRRC